MQPSATLSGPATLLLCPGSGLSLTGGYTTGEGALSPRPPRFIWAAAEGSDNLDTISAHLATVHDASEVLELDAALLDGGDHFEFTLQVVDFVGQASYPATHTVTRLATPAPVVTIEAPAHVRLSAGELLLLPATPQRWTAGLCTTAVPIPQPHHGCSSPRPFGGAKQRETPSPTSSAIH